MYPQSLVLSLFTILVSFGLCFGSYIVETNYQNEQFGFMKRANHQSHAPLQSKEIINVDDYEAKANDGQIDNEVT